MNLVFEAMFFSTYLRSQKSTTMKNWWVDKWQQYLHDRQITQNNFIDKEKEAFKCEGFCHRVNFILTTY